MREASLPAGTETILAGTNPLAVFGRLRRRYAGRMSSDPLYARYTKHYYEDSKRAGSVTLFVSGVFEEEQSDDPDALIVGEWEIVDPVADAKGAVLITRFANVVRRYDSSPQAGLPPMYAEGVEPDTGMRARMYRIDGGDEPEETKFLSGV